MFTIPDLKRYDVDAYDCRIHVAEIGEGPLVLLVHGFPLPVRRQESGCYPRVEN